MFSKACEYGIRATIFITEQSLMGNKVGKEAIAKAVDSPEAFTAKTLQILTRNRIVSSDKGPGGGFYLSAEQLDSICLSHIVAAIDGDNIYRGCALGLANCNAQKPCPMHYQFLGIREALRQMLEKTLIRDLANGVSAGLAFLKR